MSKQQEFEQLPASEQNSPDSTKEKLSKKDKIEQLVEEINKQYGIDVEPVKNNKYKLKKVITYLNEKFEFRYNLFAKKPEYRHLSKTETAERREFQFFDERDFDNLYNELDIDGGISISKDRLLSIIGSRFVSEDYDPIWEYMKGLPKWDGKDRFPMFLTQIKLVDEPNNREFLIEYFKKWFVTYVASLVYQDVINEVAVVFSGAEGRGKTRFFVNLIPKDLRLKYFFSGNFNPRDKDHLEMLGTKMLIFLDEMATINRTDSETLKTTMSNRYVVLRRAYGRGNIHLYRKASFAGAINDDKFLTDQGANRRWLPFVIDKIDVDNEFDVGLLYAQALAMFKDGFDIYYDTGEIDQLKIRNEQFRRRAPEEELIMLHWSVPTKVDIDTCTDLQYLTPTDVMYQLSSKDEYRKMNTNDTVLKRIGKTLGSLNFPMVKKRLAGYSTPRECYIMKPIDSVSIQNMKKGNVENNENLWI